VYVVGNRNELGNWTGRQRQPAEHRRQRRQRALVAHLNLPPSTAIQFKFLK
jgi:hypothetical protein